MAGLPGAGSAGRSAGNPHTQKIQSSDSLLGGQPRQMHRAKSGQTSGWIAQNGHGGDAVPQALKQAGHHATELLPLPRKIGLSQLHCPPPVSRGRRGVSGAM